jgi:hypothetical protein
MLDKLLEVQPEKKNPIKYFRHRFFKKILFLSKSKTSESPKTGFLISNSR